MKKSTTDFSRRQFVGALAATGIVAAACSSGAKGDAEYTLSTGLRKAPDGKELKAGLIGCGGRGTGAALNFLAAGDGLQVVALGDLFADRVENAKAKLASEANNQVADENCFVGFDAWEKVIDADVDVIITATPPYFRPQIFEGAINARKHVFMEKPVAVDPVGARKIMAVSKKAESLGLNVVTGTQRRHQYNYIELWKQMKQGAIGDIISANVYWNGRQPWYRTQGTWSDMEWMIRNWVNWNWLSGDHIAEQHVHNLDIAAWFLGKYPVECVGFGSRHRRKTGDQYDNFSVDFVYDDGRHVHSMCRQIDDTASDVSEYISGSKGFITSKGPGQILNAKGEVEWEVKNPVVDGEEVEAMNPYVQEHIDLVTAIRSNGQLQIVEAENTAKSTMMAIMGRISSYTGKKVTWEEMMNSNLDLTPDNFTQTAADFRKKYPYAANPPIPVPGKEKA